MEILSLSRDVGTITMKTKNPTLDQTGGPREEELVKNPSQPMLYKKGPPRQLASLLKGPNLITSLLACLLKQRSQCILPKTWKNPHIRNLKHKLLKINPLMRLLSLLIGLSSTLVKPFDLERRPSESTRNVYYRRIIIAITKFQIVEWHGYTHLDWITVRRDDDKLYTFKEDDFKRIRLQDIKDMLILLVQGKLINHNVEEHLAFSVESYQKKLNIAKPDTYRSDLKRRDAYKAYSNPRGFIFQNKDKKNKLIRMDELHKFSDGTLNDVRNALDDRLKGIRMENLPQIIWRQSDREQAAAIIQAIDKQLKSKRIMRSLERFVGGRPYRRDLRLLQRTI
ncbi:hypothetical protein Tco_0928143 [Tanacetum coccineum]